MVILVCVHTYTHIHLQAKCILSEEIDYYLDLYIVKADKEISKLCLKIINDNDVILVYAL